MVKYYTKERALWARYAMALPTSGREHHGQPMVDLPLIYNDDIMIMLCQAIEDVSFLRIIGKYANL